MKKAPLVHRRILILIICILCLLMALFIQKFIFPQPSSESPAELPLTVPPSREPAPPPTPAPTPPPTPSPVPSPTPEPTRPPLEAWPIRMRIPAISVDAEIRDTGLDTQTSSMAIVPEADIISWYRYSAIPGNEGNAFIGGHDRWAGKIGQLLYLDTLHIGDVMEIDYTDGTSLTFRLESVFVYALNTAPAHLIMDPAGEARITVITCKDPYNPAIGTSDNRIVAIFKEDSVFELPYPAVTPFPTNSPT